MRAVVNRVAGGDAGHGQLDFRGDMLGLCARGETCPRLGRGFGLGWGRW